MTWTCLNLIQHLLELLTLFFEQIELTGETCDDINAGKFLDGRSYGRIF